MPTYNTYDQVGKKEDISDIISMITPTKTPFQTMIGDDTADNTLYQWQEDELRSVQTNAQVEGFTATDATLTPTSYRQNYTQILEKTVKVSATADRVKTYGRAKELAYQLSKASAELKRDLEHAFVGLNQAAVAGNSSTARQMASAIAQIHADVSVDAGTAADLTETHFLTAMQTLYNRGSDAEVFMVKPSDSIKIANFAYASGRQRDMGNDKKLVNAVDILVTPFGEVKVVLNRFLKSDHALLLDPAMWAKVTLRPFTRETLAKTGDATTVMIVGEYSLKHKNWRGSARIFDLSTT